MSRRGESKLDVHLPEIKAAVQGGESQQHLAKRLGVSRPTLQAFVNKHHIEPAKPKPAVLSPLDPISREERLDAELRELRSHVKKSRKLDVQQDRVMEAIEAALSVAPISAFALQGKPPAQSKTAHHRQVVLLSDWHAGEVVTLEQVGGLNEFDWDILEQRVDRTISGLLSFKEVRPALTGLDVWFLGDMVSGNIHEELVATNQFPAAEQSVKAGQLMARTITELAPHYPDIHVCAIPGNHARTKKDHASKNVFDSWDWTAYKLAEAMTAPLPNVKWEIPDAGTIVRQIAGLNVLLWHGDGVRSSMPGVPWGGVMRRVNELIKQYGDIGTLLNYVALGHFHQACLVPKVWMNGSLIGTNEHGYKNYGGGEVPKQLLLTFDETKHRLTDVSYITP